MATIKVVKKRGDKIVVIKDRLSAFENYQDIRNKIIEKFKNEPNSTNKINENDLFILSFCEERDKDLYIPEELSQGIWNNQMFRHFKDKIQSHKVQSGTYKFYVNRVQKYPKWKKKEFKEYLEETLINKWNRISTNLIEELTTPKLEKAKDNFNKLKKEKNEIEKKLNEEIHHNVICNNCYKANFSGRRYICAECDNYNLCQKCEKISYQKQIHPRTHTMIRINKPLSNEINNSEFRNIIGKKEQDFQNVPLVFQIELKILNNGQNDLKDCYILPVRYGENYLNIFKGIIKDSLGRNMSKDISLVVKIPNDKRGFYEGFFRMFSPFGLPFGDIIHITVINSE